MSYVSRKTFAIVGQRDSDKKITIGLIFKRKTYYFNVTETVDLEGKTS